MIITMTHEISVLVMLWLRRIKLLPSIPCVLRRIGLVFLLLGLLGWAFFFHIGTKSCEAII